MEKKTRLSQGKGSKHVVVSHFLCGNALAVQQQPHKAGIAFKAGHSMSALQGVRKLTEHLAGADFLPIDVLILQAAGLFDKGHGHLAFELRVLASVELFDDLPWGDQLTLVKNSILIELLHKIARPQRGCVRPVGGEYIRGRDIAAIYSFAVPERTFYELCRNGRRWGCSAGRESNRWLG